MSNEVDDPLIPCEFCDTMIRFSHYESHVRPCAIRGTMQPQPSYIIYRDDDDNTVYRINIAPAIAAFHRLNHSPTNPDNLDNPGNQDVEDETNAEDEAHDGHDDSNSDDEDMRPILRHTTHSTLMIIPRIIPSFPNEVTDQSNTYEFNTLLSEAIGKVRIGLSNITAYLIDASSNITEGSITCPICQDNICESEHVVTACKHSYCKPCITKWFEEHVTCPVCNLDQRTIEPKAHL